MQFYANYSYEIHILRLKLKKVVDFTDILCNLNK